MLNRKILFFVSVVENGSFSSAAKKFYLTQSAISQQILQLEEEMGVQLFNRSGYRPVLTEAGNYFYKECKKLIEQYETIIEMAKEIEKSAKKVLNIGITGPMEKKHLPLVVNAYHEQNPEVHIDVKKTTFESGINQLVDGTLDIAFGITNDFKRKEDIQTVYLINHKVCVVCSKEHPWANRKSVNSKELEKQPIICFSEKVGNKFYFDFMQSFKEDGITPKIIKKLDALEEILLAVKMNQGIALISREVVAVEDDVVMLDIDDTHHHAEFCLGYLKKNNKEYLNSFVEEALRYFQSLSL